MLPSRMPSAATKNSSAKSATGSSGRYDHATWYWKITSASTSTSSAHPAGPVAGGGGHRVPGARRYQATPGAPDPLALTSPAITWGYVMWVDRGRSVARRLHDRYEAEVRRRFARLYYDRADE